MVNRIQFSRSPRAGVAYGPDARRPRAVAAGALSSRIRRTAAACALAFALVAAPRAGSPYAVAIHELLPLRALASDRALASESLPAVSATELAAFRAWLDAAFRTHSDDALARRYRARWPEPAGMDARAFKRLLGLNADLPLQCIDRADGLPCTALAALSIGSGQPDTDWRNRERLAHDAGGKPLKLSDGRDVPADPLILNLGNVRGLSSQAHAHYGLADLPLSPEPEVLRTEPWRFALPAGWPAGPVRAFARESCQMHYDLGVLALSWDRPAGRALGHLFLGQGMHYLEDVGNQVHTVQVGHYDLLRRARLLTWKRALFTLGGYLDDLKPWTRVGIELLTTHHVLSESLNAKRVAEALAGKPVPPIIRETLEGLSHDDPELAADIQRACDGLPPGAPAAPPPRASAAMSSPMTPAPRMSASPRPARAAAITSCVIARSCREGGEVYRHMAGALHPRMSAYGVLVDTEDVDPDSTLGDAADPAVAEHLAALYALQARAYRRVGTALRRLTACFAEDTRQVDAAARQERMHRFTAALLADRLDALDGEEERLARYLAAPPAIGATRVREPAWLMMPLIPLALVIAILRRRRAPAPGTTA